MQITFKNLRNKTINYIFFSRSMLILREEGEGMDAGMMLGGCSLHPAVTVALRGGGSGRYREEV